MSENSAKIICGRRMWSAEEDALLHELWPDMGSKCAFRFSERTIQAVQRRAYDLGLVYGRMWSESDDEVLRANYSSRGAAGCAGLFSVPRSPRSIQQRAIRLGLYIRGDKVGREVLDQHELSRLLSYNENTGQFTWKVPVGRAKSGDIASTKRASGYTVIGIRGRLYRAHRLAWLAVYGVWPTYEIDHVDGDRQNNAISNLRDVPRSINAQNIRKARGKSGLLGVFERPDTGKFRATLGLNGKSITLGEFATAEEAHEAYLAAKRELHEGCTL
jgi:hypothetical protein